MVLEVTRMWADTVGRAVGENDGNFGAGQVTCTTQSIKYGIIAIILQSVIRIE